MHDVSGVYTSPFLHADERKMALRAQKVSGAFEKRAPGYHKIRGLNIFPIGVVPDGSVMIARTSRRVQLIEFSNITSSVNS